MQMIVLLYSHPLVWLLYLRHDFLGLLMIFVDSILFEINVISSADTGCYHMLFLLKPH